MNYSNLNTTAEILEAFRNCKDAGEKIELFECLASRSDPPISAFVEILERIQLEDVLALTIQAFEKVEDADVKEKLKQSEDLLQLLSEKTKFGTSDLIRWAAAKAIDIIGFDFIMVSQYLNEEPNKIAENIVKSNYKRFTDKNFLQSNDYDKFVDFWTYGPTYQFRKFTSHIRLDVNSYGVDISSQARFYHFDEETKKQILEEEAKRVYGLYIDNINKIVENQEIYGIKRTNIYLKKAEEQDYPNDSVKQIYKNELFEAVCQDLSSKLLENASSFKDKDLEILINNQIHCLQSNYVVTREKAYLTIFGLENEILDRLSKGHPALLLVENEQRKRNQIKLYIENTFLELENIDSEFANKLVQIDFDQPSESLLGILTEEFNILISSLMSEIATLESEIATLESEEYNRIFNGEKSNTSAKYLSISKIDGCGCVVAIIGLAIVIAYWQYIIMVLIVLVIIYCFTLLLNDNERERKIKKLKSDIVEKRNYVNILENHKQNLIKIK